MNRLLIFAIGSTMIGVVKLGGVMVDPPVNLQATTPGTAQAGNINVTGAVLGGTFFGSSSGNTTKVVSGWATSPTGYVFGGDFRSSSTDGRGIFASATATTGFTYGGDFRTASVDGRGIFGYATNVNGQGIGGDFRSDSPYGTGVIGRVNNASGVPIGVFGQAPSNGFAGKFDGRVLVSTLLQAGNFIGDGSYVTNVNAHYLNGYYPTDFAILGYNATSSTYSYLLRETNSRDGGVAIRGDATSPTGSTRGVIGTSVAPNGIGVYGTNTGTSGTTYGVRGNVDSPSGFGGFFVSSATTGNGYATASQAYSGEGARGEFAANWANAGSGYGIQAYAKAPLVAMFSNGNFVSSGTKSFRIDLPSDPAHKYLLHYCTESPFPQNSYSGNVTTNDEGYATVTLPSYIDDVTINFKYQLTVINNGNDFVQSMVTKEVDHGRFQIRTSKPNVKVSWRVEGDRNDPYVKRYPPIDVQEKPPVEQGTYEHPELYGADPGLAIYRLGGPKKTQP